MAVVVVALLGESRLHQRKSDGAGDEHFSCPHRVLPEFLVPPILGDALVERGDGLPVFVLCASSFWPRCW
jgi:hypothetical protein